MLNSWFKKSIQWFKECCSSSQKISQMQHLEQLSPYKPPLNARHDYEGLLLDFNERTMPLHPAVIEALEKFLKSGKITLYPEYYDLIHKIAQYAKVTPKEIMLTSGSEQGIELIFRIFTKKSDTVIIPTPSYAMYYQFAYVINNKIQMPLYHQDNLSFPVEEVLKQLTNRVKLVVICNPNNPTGTLLELPALEQILKKAIKTGTIVYVDEAYYEYSQVTAAALLEKYPNLVITRTFSKAFGLAALRIGYMLANPNIITNLLKVRGPYDIGTTGVIAATVSLDHVSDIEKYCKEVMTQAKPMVETFFKEKQIKFYSSASNFILFEAPKGIKKEDWVQALSHKGIRIRIPKSPLIENCVRVTIGTVAQMKQFIQNF